MAIYWPAPVTGARSTALVLASRIQDYPATLGIPRAEPVGRPLPWLPAPSVGDSAWNDYLRLRAGLIAEHAARLGTLEAAYREQYQLTHLPPGDLGKPPVCDGLRRTAYRAVVRSLGRDEAAMHGSDLPPSRNRRSLTAVASRPITSSNSRPAPARSRS